jgi:hypothetical protein
MMMAWLKAMAMHRNITTTFLGKNVNFLRKLKRNALSGSAVNLLIIGL